MVYTALLHFILCVQSVVNKCMREPTFVLFKQQKRQRRKRKKSCIQYALSSEIVDLKIHKANSLGYTEIKNRHPGSSNDSKFKTALKYLKKLTSENIPYIINADDQ